MKILNLVLLPLIAFLAGCAELRDADRPSSVGDADARFARLADEFIAGYLAWRPATGTTLGLHEYDGKLTDFSRDSLQNAPPRLKRFDRELAAFPVQSLSQQSFRDYRVLRTAISGELFV